MKRNRLFVTGLAILMVCSIVSGCGKKQEPTVERQQVEETKGSDIATEEKEVVEEVPDDGKFHGKWIVDAEYAIGRIGAEDTLFVDSRGEKQAIMGTIQGLSQRYGRIGQFRKVKQEMRIGDVSWNQKH